MQHHWLNKENNKKIIVFFAGWSFDHKAFEYLDTKDFDILMFYDYNDIEIPKQVQNDMSNYKEKYLITWSMGVFIAYLLKNKLPAFDKKIAINGTPHPVNDKYGIPHKTFQLTLKYAETGLQGKFYKNVFSDDTLYDRYIKNPIERSTKNRVEELINLDKLIKSTEIEYDNYYDSAIVAKDDKIIPTKNQINFWSNKATIVDSGHFPFYNYKSWDELCK